MSPRMLAGGLTLAVVLALALPATALARTDRFAGAPPIGAVSSEQFIVGVRAGVSPQDVKRALLQRGLLHPTDEVQASGDRLVGAFSTSARAVLGVDGRVAYVEPVQRVTTVSSTQMSPPQGLDRLDQRELPLSVSYTYERTGVGVRSYVVDTGIRADHADFSGRVEPGFDARGEETTSDCNGHGTHVAGTIGGVVHGVAKDTAFVPVRVLDCAGAGSTDGVARGVDWITSNHPPGTPGVVTMSLGSVATSQAVDDAVRRAVGAGLTVVVAAGNSGGDACGYSPARVAEAITVTASDPETDERPWYANTGSCVDLFAPGVDIESAWHTSETATAVASGTSMAAPHVAGIAAMYLQENPTAAPSEVRAAILRHATQDAIADPGTATPNLLAFSYLGPPEPVSEPQPQPQPESEPQPQPESESEAQPEPEPEPEPGAPSPPREVTAAAGDRAAQVSWSPPADEGAGPVTRYLVYASPDNHAPQTVSADTTVATVPGLESGQAYRFAVIAENAAGRSGPSEASNAVTPFTSEPEEPAEPRAQEACPDGEVPPSGFGDIAGSVHESVIDCIVWYGITRGTGHGMYGPAVSVRRDQLASFLVRELHAADVRLPAPSDQGFRDIAGNVHADAINQLAELGVAQGTSPTTFAPAADVRRDQLATFVDRVHEQVTGARLPAGRSRFTDTAGNPHARAIDALAAAEIVNGVTPERYGPARSVRRDQMAAFLARHLGVLAEAGHVSPPSR